MGSGHVTLLSTQEITCPLNRVNSKMLTRPRWWEIGFWVALFQAAAEDTARDDTIRDDTRLGDDDGSNTWNDDLDTWL